MNKEALSERLLGLRPAILADLITHLPLSVKAYPINLEQAAVAIYDAFAHYLVEGDEEDYQQSRREAMAVVYNAGIKSQVVMDSLARCVVILSQALPEANALINQRMILADHLMIEESRSY